MNIIAYKCVDNSKIIPNKMQVIKGQHVRFECLSHGWIKWTFNDDGLLPDNIIRYNNFIIIHRAQFYNAGVYECNGESKFVYSWSEDSVLFYSRATLTVVGRLHVVRKKYS